MNLAFLDFLYQWPLWAEVLFVCCVIAPLILLVPCVVVAFIVHYGHRDIFHPFTPVPGEDIDHAIRIPGAEGF